MPSTETPQTKNSAFYGVQCGTFDNNKQEYWLKLDVFPIREKVRSTLTSR